MREERQQRGLAARLVMEEVELDLWDEPTPHPWPPLPTLIITAKDQDALRSGVRNLAEQISRRAVAELPEEVNAAGELAWDEHGVALLNRGTPLCSVENDDTMALIFMHSVRWSRAHLPFKPVAEHKTHRFEYALYPHPGDWREGRVPWAAYEYNNRLIAVQTELSEGQLPAQMAFMSTEGDAIITALKAEGFPIAGHEEIPQGRPQRAAVRMYEPSGFGTKVKLQWFSGISGAARANMLEEAQRQLKAAEGVSVNLKPFEIATLLLELKPPSAELGAQELGRRLEPGQPVYFAHWEHNAGAAPLGYSPVAITLRGRIRPDTHIRQGWYTVNTFRVGLVNNLSVPVSGTVRFELPEAWRTIPETIEYELAPRQGAEYSVTLIFDDRQTRRGAVRAIIEHEGQEYETVLEVGDSARLDWDVRVLRSGATVVIRSDYPQPVNVDAYAVVPHELWGDVVEGACLGHVGPRYCRIVVPPGGKAQWRIDVDATEDAWLTVKLAYHGRVEYKQVRLGR